MSERPDFYALIARNRRWTWFLLVIFFILLSVVALTVSVVVGGGVIGAVAGIGIAFGTTFFSYANSKSLALRSARAKPASIEAYLQLHNIVETVALAAGIPKPQVYIVDDPAPNAFATGRNPDDAAVAATTGLLAKLDRDELEGVMAHEIAHIRNYDIRVMTVAAATAGAIAIIVDIFWRMLYFGGGRSRNNRGGGGNPLAIVGFVIVAMLAPLAAAMLKAAISRRREGLADATAIELTRYPGGLRMALEKLDADSTVIARTSHATSHLWIESPDDHEPGHKGRQFNDMFDTHPPLRERINLLRRIEGLPPYEGPSDATIRDLQTRPAARQEPKPQQAPTTGHSAADDVDWSALGIDTPQRPIPGWYPDPAGDESLIRYWDGQSWTGDVKQR